MSWIGSRAIQIDRRSSCSITRHALALAYLSAPRHSVSEVTYLLGFSAGSCFTRAFRRWTGQSPSDWRAGIAPSTETLA